MADKPFGILMFILLNCVVRSQQFSTVYSRVSKPNQINSVPAIEIKNRIEYVQICRKNIDTSISITELSNIIDNKAYLSSDKSKQCTRFFNKISLFDQQQWAHPSNPQINNQYNNASRFLFDIKSLINKDFDNIQPSLTISDINWQSLQQFNIHLSWNIQKQALELDSVQLMDRKIIQKQSAGIISKKLSGKGFHQHANMTLQINDKYDINVQQCSVIISEVLPETTYIDYDQLWSKIGKKPEIVETISVQTPAYLSKQFEYKVQIPLSSWKQTGVNEYRYLLPIHYRYPRPSASQEYQLVKLHPSTSINIKCKGSQKNYNIVQDYLNNKGVAKIPVGDSDDAKLVSTMTLVSQVICAVLLMKKIKR